MLVDRFRGDSPCVEYTEDVIKSTYEYQTTEFVHEQRTSDGKYEWIARPKAMLYQFATQRKVPKLGMILVGWGGNNGSTLAAGILAKTEFWLLAFVKQGCFMGDKGRSAARKLFWISHPGVDLPCGFLPRRGNSCALQECSAHGGSQRHCDWRMGYLQHELD